jgi:hypothetical protein
MEACLQPVRIWRTNLCVRGGRTCAYVAVRLILFLLLCMLYSLTSRERG